MIFNVEIIKGKRKCIYDLVPNAARIPADQKTSPHNAGIKRRPPILPPKHSCKGSSIVI